MASANGSRSPSPTPPTAEQRVANIENLMQILLQATGALQNSGNAAKWDTWLHSIKAKLRVDGPAIGDATAQFYYVYLNLESSAQALVLPQLSYAEDNEEWDYRTILDQLARAYHSPVKVQEAKSKLYRISQGADSLAAYIIDQFREGLNQTIKSRLASQLILSEGYSAFLKVVQQLGSRTSTNGQHVSFEASASHPSFSSPRPGLYNPSTPRSATRGTDRGDPMDLSALDMNSINVFDPTISSIEISELSEARVIDHGNPIELRENSSDTMARLNAVDGKLAAPAQISRWKQQNRCTQCGSDRHWSNVCPSGSGSPSRSRASSRSSSPDNRNAVYAPAPRSPGQSPVRPRRDERDSFARNTPNMEYETDMAELRKYRKIMENWRQGGDVSEED